MKTSHTITPESAPAIIHALRVACDIAEIHEIRGAMAVVRIADTIGMEWISRDERLDTREGTYEVASDLMMFAEAVQRGVRS